MGPAKSTNTHECVTIIQHVCSEHVRVPHSPIYGRIYDQGGDLLSSPGAAGHRRWPKGQLSERAVCARKLQNPFEGRQSRLLHSSTRNQCYYTETSVRTHPAWHQKNNPGPQKKLPHTFDPQLRLCGLNTWN